MNKETTKKEGAKKAEKNKAWSELVNFLSGTKAELRKVNWPDRKQVLTYTGVVLTAVAIMAVLIWVIDLGLGRLLTLIVER
ncbi:MAG: preprotein translocase subunit SecE [Bacillota bacterium]